MDWVKNQITASFVRFNLFFSLKKKKTCFILPSDTDLFQSCPVDGEAPAGDLRLGNQRPPAASSWGGGNADAADAAREPEASLHDVLIIDAKW